MAEFPKVSKNREDYMPVNRDNYNYFDTTFYTETLASKEKRYQYITIGELLELLRDTGIYCNFKESDSKQEYMVNFNNSWIFNNQESINNKDQFVKIKHLESLGIFDMVRAARHHIFAHRQYIDDKYAGILSIPEKIRAVHLPFWLTIDEDNNVTPIYHKDTEQIDEDKKQNLHYNVWIPIIDNCYVTKETLLYSYRKTYEEPNSWFEYSRVIPSAIIEKDGKKYIKIISHCNVITSIGGQFEREFYECKVNQHFDNYTVTGNERFLSGYWFNKKYGAESVSNTALFMLVDDSVPEEFQLPLHFSVSSAYNFMDGLFNNCTALVKVVGSPCIPTFGKNTRYNMYQLFTENKYPEFFNYAPVGNYETLFINNYNMFGGCVNLREVGDIFGTVDVDKLKSEQAEEIKASDIFEHQQQNRLFGRTYIYSIEQIFMNCPNLGKIDTAIFDYSKYVRNFRSVFYGACSNVPAKSVPIDLRRMLRHKKLVTDIYCMTYMSGGLRYTITDDLFESQATRLTSADYCFSNAGWEIDPKLNGVFPPLFKGCSKLITLQTPFWENNSNNYYESLVTFHPDLLQGCVNLQSIVAFFKCTSDRKPGFTWNYNNYSDILYSKINDRTPNFKRIELAKILRDCVSLRNCSYLFNESTIEYLGEDKHYFKACKNLVDCTKVFSSCMNLKDEITIPFKGCENIETFNNCFSYSTARVNIEEFFSSSFPKLKICAQMFLENRMIDSVIYSDLFKNTPNVENIKEMFKSCVNLIWFKKKNDGRGLFDWIPKAKDATAMFAEVGKHFKDSPNYVKITKANYSEYISDKGYGCLPNNFFSQSGENQITTITNILYDSVIRKIGDRLFENCHELKTASFAFNYCQTVHLGHSTFLNCEKLEDATNCFGNFYFNSTARSDYYDLSDDTFYYIYMAYQYPLESGTMLDESVKSWFAGCTSLKQVNRLFIENRYSKWVMHPDTFKDCPNLENIEQMLINNFHMCPAFPIDLFKHNPKISQFEYCFQNVGYNYRTSWNTTNFPWRNISRPSIVFTPLWPVRDSSAFDLFSFPSFAAKFAELGGPNSGVKRMSEHLYSNVQYNQGLPPNYGIDIPWSGSNN